MTTPPLALLLNLESRPDRRAFALERCRAAGIEPTVHLATTPEDLTDLGLGWDPSLPPGSAACTESHLAMMERVVESGVPWAMILEDDVTFVPDFASRYRELLAALPGEWDFVQLGWLPTNDESTTRARTQRRLAASPTARRIAHRVRPATPVVPNPVPAVLPSWGTHCYLVSRRMAERLSHLRGGPPWTPIDWFLREYLELGVTNGVSPLRYFRARVPLAGQDWGLGSDVDEARFGTKSHQLDADGRTVVWSWRGGRATPRVGSGP